MNQNPASFHPHASILVVEDEEMTVRLLKRMLQRAGYHQIHTTMDPLEALELYRELDPDLVILDLHMPDGEGFAVLAELRAGLPQRAYLPVLMLTGDTSPEAKHQAFILGVTDFLTKPLDFLEVRYRVSNLLQTRYLYLEMQHRNQLLDEGVRIGEGELEESRSDLQEHLLAPRRRGSPVRQNLVGQVAAELAGELGLAEEEIERIRWAAHLFRAAGPGALDPAVSWFDRLVAQESARMSSCIREEAKLLFASPAPELLAVAEEMVLARHEHWDGSGYPQGLSGEQIPLPARIAAVAEHFAVLSGSPLYRDRGPGGVSLVEIVIRAGRRFDPQVVKALTGLHARGEVGASAMGRVGA